ncbi:NifU family protein [Bradyrhizobium sp. 25ACV]
MLAESKQLKQTTAAEMDREQVICALLEEVRPNLKRDGGDCQLVAIDGTKIMVKLTGACVLCKLSASTLEGIQARLIEKLGEFVRLIPVAGAPTAPY